MAKHCVKCGRLLAEGTETCIICGKPGAIPEQYIHFVTAPGGRRIEDSSTIKSRKKGFFDSLDGNASSVFEGI